jgi:hypothetical protein
VLLAYRTFFENIYSFIRLVERKMDKRGWALIKNGGYGVTRNGTGGGLGDFDNWVTTRIGVAFVDRDQTTTNGGVTNTIIKPAGLALVAFQLRWTSEASLEPVVWGMRLVVRAVGPKPPQKWEEYQSAVFARVDADGDRTRSVGALNATAVAVKATTIQVEGRYVEARLRDVNGEEDVMKGLISRTLDLPAVA